jgi:hypothetical protein
MWPSYVASNLGAGSTRLLVRKLRGVAFLPHLARHSSLAFQSGMRKSGNHFSARIQLQLLESITFMILDWTNPKSS